MLDEIASCHLRSFRIRQKIKPTNLVSFVFAYGLLFIVLYLLLAAWLDLIRKELNQFVFNAKIVFAT